MHRVWFGAGIKYVPQPSHAVRPASSWKYPGLHRSHSTFAVLLFTVLATHCSQT